MLSPDYQEFANRGSLTDRDNSVISRLGTGEVTEITPALPDYHENHARKRNFLPAGGRKLPFCALAKSAVEAEAAPPLQES
ncbi:hypothetical protein JQ625_13735 [Bradyrhizobium diazoefficiens]|nr:hypothetical protein [Bradyrhizobium diazoefficiens]MBR0775894.1 hypothetical protein [Bradyrhizobium diazoefficiens]